MHITVKRFGGPIPRPPKVNSFEDRDLDEEARRALQTLFSDAREIPVSERVPDGYTYRFEIAGDGDDEKKSVSVKRSSIPDILQALLP